VQRLTGARLIELSRRGKYILGRLDREETLIMHLGMTGRFEIEGGPSTRAPGKFTLAATADPKHAHVIFHTETGARVTYFDARRFGFMDLCASGALDAHPRFLGMGPEPLGEAFTADYLATAFKGRRQGAKTLLLDQKLVAGLGNIYVCEALHRARISPIRAAGGISRRKLTTLVASVRSVLDEALIAGGSTLRDFAGADGALGYFQHSFEAYGRQGEPCGNRGCRGVIERLVQGGRSTFHCPVCQK
jgi:formamidopyrimidine-DNA glycosylase